MKHRQENGNASRPNMLAAALLSGGLGLFMAVLMIMSVANGKGIEAFDAFLATGLLVVAFCAGYVHRNLQRMTPHERVQFWKSLDAATEENHRRNVEHYVRRGRDGNGLG